MARFHGYGFTGTPAVAFDGLLTEVGGYSSGSMYPNYLPHYNTRRVISSPLAITADYTLVSNTIELNLDIEVTEPVTTTNNVVTIAICQDGFMNHPFMSRMLLPDEPFTLTSVGQTVNIQRSVPLNFTWTDDVRVVIFVQSQTSDEVLQAGLAEANYAGTIEVATLPAGIDGGWTVTGPGATDVSGLGDDTVPVWFAGDYTITWDDVPGWTTPVPNPVLQTLVEDGLITFTGTWTDGPFAALTVAPLGDAGAGRGVSLADMDEDGDLDIYLVNEDGANRLLRNDGGLSFTDIATGLVADAGAGRCGVFGDYNGDGHLDLYITQSLTANVILEGDGLGGFITPAAYGAADEGDGSGASWVDYDLDGILDIYAVNLDGANKLLRNQGDLGGGFYLFAPQSGLINESGVGYCAAWADYDDDGDPDVYIVNDGYNFLLENFDGTGFSDNTGSGIMSDRYTGRAAAWGDYDNDQDLDLYLTNDGVADLLAGNGGSWFSMVLGDNVGDRGAGHGVVWLDYDLDRDLDLYISRQGETDLLLRNENGSGDFTFIPLALSEVLADGNGVASGDLDGDGDLDLYLANDGQANVLLENQYGGTNHWLKVELAGLAPNTFAVGAKVYVTAGGETMMRQAVAGEGYLSQNAPTLHFGLGDATTVARVHVVWPDGFESLRRDVAADQTLVVDQSDPSAVDDAPVARRDYLADAYPNPFNPTTTIAYELKTPSSVDLRVFDLSGRLVRVLRAGAREIAGPHEVVWDGTDATGRSVASGTYIYRLQAGEYRQTKAMTLVK